MLAYCKTLKEFQHDVNTNKIEEEVVKNLKMEVGESERRSFRRSLPAIARALNNCQLPDEVDVALEYRIPLTAKRVDFIIAGADDEGKDHLIICELKQWERVSHTDMPDVVEVGGRLLVHPSWQAYTYGSTLANFNEFIETHDVKIDSCAFLHEYDRRYIDELIDPIYSEGLKKAEPFISDQFENLSTFVSRYIKKKSNKDLMFEIERGRIRPSKMLTESVEKLLKGNDDFELIDQQRVVFSSLYREIEKASISSNHEKHVFIVEGGAGTGKSLIAIKLLADLISKKGKKAFYVAKSSYVKENYRNKLTKKDPEYKFLHSLFLGSGTFIESYRNEFDVLIVDEAHRLTEKTKYSYFYKGKNQIEEIINASKISVFFIDETQNIDIKDYGTIENIERIASSFGARIHRNERYVLDSQFRCNGSDEYIAWIESVLYNKDYLKSGEKVDYDIRLFDNLVEMKNAIVEKNNCSKQPSRILSGDVFDWLSHNDKTAVDIVIGDFSAQWNKTQAFATNPKSIDEVGCIHTSQGMEFEYAGLIVASDIAYRNGRVVTDYTKHPSKATEFKRPHQRRVLPEDVDIIDKLIRNTYKVLFTRGQKGCYIYVMDDELREYLRTRIQQLLS